MPLQAECASFKREVVDDLLLLGVELVTKKECLPLATSSDNTPTRVRVAAGSQAETRGAVIHDRNDSEHRKATKRRECVTVSLHPSAKRLKSHLAPYLRLQRKMWTNLLALDTTDGK